jgi:sulfur-oxidizing protein SoxX
MAYGTFSLSAIILGACLILGTKLGVAAEEKKKLPQQTGKELAVTYCQACHYFEGTNQAGTIAPPLVGMKARFPDRAPLRNTIYDPHVARPHTMMPPFGRNGLLTEAQIEQIIDFLYGL